MSDDDDKGTDLVLSRSQEIEKQNQEIADSFRKLNKRIAKVEAFRAANVEKSLHFFTDKIDALEALSQNWRDPETGKFDPQRIKRADGRQLDIYFAQVSNIEKMAGMLPTVKQERSVTVTLADEFKQLQSSLNENIIDAEIVEDAE